MTNNPSSSALDSLDDGALAERLADASRRITTELRKGIVGQDAVVEQALIALFAGGNCLLVGVPGLAKTLLIHSLSRALDLRFIADPVHARPDAERRHRHRHDHR
ncbi:MAG: hypothetical protein V9E87_13385 [Gemmatimonadales bacterium]